MTKKQEALEALCMARETAIAMDRDQLAAQVLVLQIGYAHKCVDEISETKRPRRAAKKLPDVVTAPRTPRVTGLTIGDIANLGDVK